MSNETWKIIAVLGLPMLGGFFTLGMMLGGIKGKILEIVDKKIKNHKDDCPAREDFITDVRMKRD
jgi:hypothetical protein